MIKIVFSLSAAFLLAGCATVSEPIPGPNGGSAYFIKCGSAMMQKCYEQAAKVCPGGYTVIDNQGNPNAMVTQSGGIPMVVRGPNQLMVECKK